VGTQLWCVASVHDSGETHQGGHITKEGRRDLRGVMVEAAWVAVEHHPPWQAQFARLTKRIGKQKAIVAIARKLLVAVWHVLTEQEADTNAQAQAVARKLMNWITHHGVIPGQHRDRLLLLCLHPHVSASQSRGRFSSPIGPQAPRMLDEPPALFLHTAEVLPS